MKMNQNTKEQLKDSIKILLTMFGVTGALTLGIIVAASVSGKPKYDKRAHADAKRAYDVACDAYDITYDVAVCDAERETYMANENWPLLWELCITQNALKTSPSDELDARYDSLNAELDERINDKMSMHCGLIAATDEMAAARAELEKYERDSATRAAWANQPLNRRINNSLQKIFLTEQQRKARVKQFYYQRKHNGK